MANTILRDVLRARIGAVVTQPQIAESDGNPWYCPREKNAQREYSGIFPNSRLAKHPTPMPAPKNSCQQEKPSDSRWRLNLRSRMDQQMGRTKAHLQPLGELPQHLLTKTQAGFDPEQSVRRDRDRHAERVAQARRRNHDRTVAYLAFVLVAVAQARAAQFAVFERVMGGE